MNVRAWVSLAACGAGLLLSGCGGGVAPSSSLAGNWLIVGPLPTNQLQIGGVSGFRLAITIDVTGNSLVASGFVNESCSNQDPVSPFLSRSVSFTTLAQGTVAADGSFTLQTPTNFQTNSLVIQGKVPQANGTWA